MTPYDREIVPLGNQACPISRITLAHTGTFQFATPGTKTITVHSAADLEYPITIVVQ